MLIDHVRFLQVREIKTVREEEQAIANEKLEEQAKKLQRQLQAELTVITRCECSLFIPLISRSSLKQLRETLIKKWQLKEKPTRQNYRKRGMHMNKKIKI